MRDVRLKQITTRIINAPKRIVWDYKGDVNREFKDYDVVSVQVKFPHERKGFYYRIICNLSVEDFTGKQKVVWICRWHEVQEQETMDGLHYREIPLDSVRVESP